MQQASSLKYTVSRSSAFVFIGKFIRYAFFYGTQVLLINLLIPDDFGIMRYVTLMIGMANLLYEMGLTTALVQKEQISSEEIWCSFYVSLIWGIVLFCFIFVFAPLAASFFKSQGLAPYLRTAGLIILISSISAVPRALLQRKMRFDLLAAAESSSAVLSCAVTVFLAYRNFGAWSLVIGSLAFETMTLAIFLSVTRFPRLRFDVFRYSRALLIFGAGIVVLRICDYLMFAVPFLTIGKFLSEKALGLFSVTYDLALLPQLVIGAVFVNVVLSSFSRLKGDTLRISGGFSMLTMFSSLAALPPFLIMIVFPNEIIRCICFLKHNNEWIAAATLLQWLSTMGIFYLFSVFPLIIWLSYGRIKSAAGWNFSALLTNVLAVFTGIHWGITGVCIALTARAVITFPIFTYVNYRVTGISVGTYLKSIFPATVSGCAMLVPLLLIRYLAKLVGSGDFLTLTCAVGTGLIVYLSMLPLFFRKPIEPLISILNFKGRFFKLSDAA